MTSANFIIVAQHDDVVIIKDIGPWHNHPTVTNDAEQVVEKLAPMLNGRRLEYYDSDNQLDQLLVTSDGKFGGFVPSKYQQILNRLDKL